MLFFSEIYIELAKALLAAQQNMAKVRTNATAKTEKYSYGYADLSVVIEAVLPAFSEAGIIVSQGASTSENGATVTVETRFTHVGSGQWMSSSLSLRPTKADPQGVGSAITYARRYALLAMCGIAPADDDGRAASEKQKTEQPPPQVTQRQLDDIGKVRDRLAQRGLDEKVVRAFFVDAADGLGFKHDYRTYTAHQASQFINSLHALGKKLTDSLPPPTEGGA